LFCCALIAEGQQLYLHNEILAVKSNNIFFFTHQVASKSFHNLPDIPIFQSLSNLQVVIVRLVANLNRGQRSGGVAHDKVLVECGGGSGLSLNITSLQNKQNKYVLNLSHPGGSGI